MSTELTATISSQLLKSFFNETFSSKIRESFLLNNEKKQTDKQKSAKVTEWYQSQRLVMVLGAGSSVPYGLPDWNTLLQKILLITILVPIVLDGNTYPKSL